MQTISRLGTLFVLASALAFAESWTGKLVDANCDMQQKMSSCSATTSTTSFALLTSEDKIYKFDSEGNKKAAEAFKKSESGAERSKNPDEQRPEATATVSGTLHDNEIAVDSIEVH